MQQARDSTDRRSFMSGRQNRIHPCSLGLDSSRRPRQRRPAYHFLAATPPALFRALHQRPGIRISSDHSATPLVSDKVKIQGTMPIDMAVLQRPQNPAICTRTREQEENSA